MHLGANVDDIRTMLERYVVWQFRRAEMAEMIGDTDTWEDATDAEQDGHKALDMLAANRW